MESYKVLKECSKDFCAATVYTNIFMVKIYLKVNIYAHLVHFIHTN